MRVPLSWLGQYVELPDGIDPADVANRLTAAGLQVERVEYVGHDISGVVVAKVLDIEELTGFKKPVRWVTIADGADDRQVICGATNFAVGDVVAYARPPASLPGGFEITARQAYGHISDGMICSARELGVSEDHTGILVLEPSLALGSDVVAAMGLRDVVLDIAINPDRGYALSVRGVAREVATGFGVGFRDPAKLPLASANGAGYDVKIDDIAGCDRYIARAVTDMDPSAASPAWLQRRLVLCGMRPVSLAVDVTNHVMLDVGQPMHAFDRHRLTGAIVVRRAKPGERLTTLDDVDRELHPEDLVIGDDSGAIALAGVMGGAATEIRSDTRSIVLEAAHFDPVSVAVTARRHRLPSEASRRFERGVDDDLPPYAAELAIGLLTEFGGATATADTTDADLRAPRPVIRMAADFPGRIAGVPYSAKAVQERLVDVGCHVESEGAVLEIVPPPWRPDLRRSVDLVEEVVRLEGYADLPSVLPRATPGHGLTRRQRLTRQIGRLLAAEGLSEVFGDPFVAADSGDHLMVAADDPRRPSVRVANPVSDTAPYLRASLLSGLFTAAARSLGRGLPDVAMFELGPVFRVRPGTTAAPRLPAGVRPSDADLAALDAALPDQPGRVAIVLTGNRERGGWWGPARPASWADAIDVVRTVANRLGVDVTIAADSHPPFHPGRCAAIRSGQALLGHAGELHPRVVEAFDLPPRSCAAEIGLDELLGEVADIGAGPTVSAYPAASFDLAFTVAAEVPAADVAAALRGALGDLLEELRLFDVYTGQQVGAGHKSLAFSVRLRAPDRTLNQDEIATARDAAVTAAAAETGAALRAG